MSAEVMRLASPAATPLSSPAKPLSGWAAKDARPE
eukprot:COSAG02_NODE_6997_length_3236_cov_43.132930_1_plen_34_part_10